MTYRRLAMRALLLASAVFITFPAQAQQAECLPISPEKVRADLKRQYGEDLIAMGISQSGQQLVHIARNPGNGSWTIYVHHPARHLVCIAAAGQSWRDVVQEKGDNL